MSIPGRMHAGMRAGHCSMGGLAACPSLHVCIGGRPFRPIGSPDPGAAAARCPCCQPLSANGAHCCLQVDFPLAPLAALTQLQRLEVTGLHTLRAGCLEKLSAALTGLTSFEYSGNMSEAGPTALIPGASVACAARGWLGSTCPYARGECSALQWCPACPARCVSRPVACLGVGWEEADTAGGFCGRCASQPVLGLSASKPLPMPLHTTCRQTAAAPEAEHTPWMQGQPAPAECAAAD